MDVQIRWLIRRDMPEILAIEKLCYEFPWDEEDFMRLLRQRNYIGMVAEDGANIHAYMIYSLHKSRLEMANLAVLPSSQRQGIGTQMIQRLVGKLHAQRRTEITGLIRERNLDAQLFFCEMGFKAVTIVRGHYDDTDEDAYLFRYVLPQEAPKQWANPR